MPAIFETKWTYSDNYLLSSKFQRASQQSSSRPSSEEIDVEEDDGDDDAFSPTNTNTTNSSPSALSGTHTRNDSNISYPITLFQTIRSSPTPLTVVWVASRRWLLSHPARCPPLLPIRPSNRWAHPVPMRSSHPSRQIIISHRRGRRTSRLIESFGWPCSLVDSWMSPRSNEVRNAEFSCWKMYNSSNSSGQISGGCHAEIECACQTKRALRSFLPSANLTDATEYGRGSARRGMVRKGESKKESIT